MFDLGIQELIVIFIVALLVFGPKRLPELGRTLGKGMAELRKAMENMRTQVHTEFDINHKTGEVHTPIEGPKTEDRTSEYAAPSPDSSDRKDEKVDDR